MKTNSLLALIFVISQAVLAQSPESIHYQTVSRDAGGNLLASQPVSFRLSIVQGSPSGTLVYQETHSVTTNQFGIANLYIGKGVVTNGTFSAISWGTDSYWLKTELDPNGGLAFVVMGTTQFISVPYALYSKKAGETTSGWSVNGNLLGGTEWLGSTNSQPVKVYSNNAERMRITENGNVGIGTTNPTKQLELTQSLKFPETTSAATGVIYKGETPFMHNYKGPGAYGYNTFLGLDAGNFTMGGANYQGCNNTGIGQGTLYNTSTGYANTAVGSFAMQANTVGIENTGIGVQSLLANTNGNRNTALGYMAGHENTAGGNNTLIGHNANYYNQGGGNNTIIGYEAGKGSSLHNKSGNIFIGTQAGFNETGSNKLYIENSNSATPLIGGDFSLNEVYINGKLRIADGTQAAGRVLLSDANGTGSWNNLSAINDNDWTINGVNLYSAVSGNVGIGTSNPLQQLEISQSLRMPTTTSGTAGVIYKGDVPFIHNYYKSSISFDLNTFIGLGSGNFTMGGTSDYQGTNNAGTGYNSLHALTTGFANTANGSLSLPSNTTGFENTAMGLHSMYSNISGNKNTGMGVYALFSNTSGAQNTVVGMGANYFNQTGSMNTMLGFEAGKGAALHNKSGNVFLGYQAGLNETGSNKLYIENSMSSTPLIGGDFSTDVAFINGKLGIGTTNPQQPLEVSGYAYINGRLGIGTATPAYQLDLTQTLNLPYTTGSNAGVIAKGGVRFLHDYTVTSPPSNVFLGYNAGNFSITSAAIENTAVGASSLTSLTTGSGNTAVGIGVMSGTTTATNNTGVGYWALKNATNTQQNTAVGFKSMQTDAGFTGNVNTGIGSFAGTRFNVDNSTGLGYLASPSASNQVHVGNTSVTWIGGQVSWSTYSDGRAKRNISENIPGLDFVLALRPVSYQYDITRLDELMGVTPPPDEPDCMKQARVNQEKITYSGFIAQEVEQAAQKCGYNFSGVQAPVNEYTPYSLRYAEFVVPLVKAMQEQQAIIDQQQKQIRELLTRIEALERK